MKVWDLRAGLSATLVVHPGDTTADVWSVAFGTYSFNFGPRQRSITSIKKRVLFADFNISANSETTDRIFAAGYDNGDVKIFDHRGNSYVWDVNVGSGVRHNPSAVYQVGP